MAYDLGNLEDIHNHYRYNSSESKTTGSSTIENMEHNGWLIAPMWMSTILYILISICICLFIIIIVIIKKVPKGTVKMRCLHLCGETPDTVGQSDSLITESTKSSKLSVYGERTHENKNIQLKIESEIESDFLLKTEPFGEHMCEEGNLLLDTALHSCQFGHPNSASVTRNNELDSPEGNERISAPSSDPGGANENSVSGNSQGVDGNCGATNHFFDTALHSCQSGHPNSYRVNRNNELDSPEGSERISAPSSDSGGVSENSAFGHCADQSSDPGQANMIPNPSQGPGQPNFNPIPSDEFGNPNLNSNMSVAPFVANIVINISPESSGNLTDRGMTKSCSEDVESMQRNNIHGNAAGPHPGARQTEYAANSQGAVVSPIMQPVDTSGPTKSVPSGRC